MVSSGLCGIGVAGTTLGLTSCERFRPASGPVWVAGVPRHPAIQANDRIEPVRRHLILGDWMKEEKISGMAGLDDM
jgi:hypothetical protein